MLKAPEALPISAGATAPDHRILGGGHGKRNSGAGKDHRHHQCRINRHPEWQWLRSTSSRKPATAINRRPPGAVHRPGRPGDRQAARTRTALRSTAASASRRRAGRNPARSGKTARQRTIRRTSPRRTAGPSKPCLRQIRGRENNSRIGSIGSATTAIRTLTKPSPAAIRPGSGPATSGVPSSRRCCRASVPRPARCRAAHQHQPTNIELCHPLQSFRRYGMGGQALG